MKRNLVRLTAWVLLFVLFVSSSSASTVKLAPVGSAEEIISAVAVYCDKWHELIGADLGYNMAFDETNITLTQDWHTDVGGNRVKSFNFDGIVADLDEEMNVYTLMVGIESGRKEQYTSTARIFGIICAVAYDYPSSERAMTDRYLTLLGEYLDFMEKNKDTLAAGEFAYLEITTEKGEFEFQFFAYNGKTRMIFDKMYFAD